MKKLLALLTTCAGIVFANPAPADTPFFTPFDGGAPLSAELHATLKGRAVTLLRITVDYHQMNLPPHSAQPIGLRYFYYILKGSDAGNAARCERWVTRVQKDEAAWTKASTTFPYLEMNFAQGAKAIVVNKMQVFKETDIQCWEGMDFGQPIF